VDGLAGGKLSGDGLAADRPLSDWGEASADGMSGSGSALGREKKNGSSSSKKEGNLMIAVYYTHRYLTYLDSI
jgi:hypothetical protein